MRIPLCDDLIYKMPKRDMPPDFESVVEEVPDVEWPGGNNWE